MPLKLFQRKPDGPWWLRGSIRGVRIYESTRTCDKGAAEQIRIKTEATALERSIHGDAVSRTFAEAALSYQKNGGDGFHLEKLIRHFGRMPVGSIGDADLKSASSKLFAGKSPSTINRQLYTPTVAILNHAAKLKWCSKPVVERPKQPKGRVRWVTPAEADKLIECAAPHLKPLVIFLFSTGARLSEALYLDWRDVDLSRAHVVFLDTKNGENRGVPLHPRAVAALANQPIKTGAVFRTQKKRPYEVREGGGGQVKTAWAGMCRRAGVEDFSPHDCRHTWATWHYAANRDLLSLMQLGGWKSLAMVERYAHINTAQHAGGIKKMWKNAK